MATARQMPARKLRAVCRGGLRWRANLSADRRRARSGCAPCKPGRRRLAGPGVADWGDDGFGALSSEKVAQVVGVVGFVRDQSAHWQYGGQQPPAAMNVVHLSCGQHQGVEAALPVGERVDLGRGSATRPADWLSMLPPFAPAAERCARTAELSTPWQTRAGPRWPRVPPVNPAECPSHSSDQSGSTAWCADHTRPVLPANAGPRDTDARCR